MVTLDRFSLNLILDFQKRLLMLLRSSDARLGPNKWGLPAGKIEPGEPPKAAAVREMREEIGTNHKVKFIRYVGPIRDTYYGGKYEIHLFQHDWQDGEITLNEEHLEYAWVRKEQISTMDVMLGIEEDIAILGLWPKQYLNRDRLPR